MNERQQITYMQARICRMASERWNKTLKDVIVLFNSYKVLEYIEAGFGIFHMEGDEAVFEDITSYLQEKGAVIHATP